MFLNKLDIKEFKRLNEKLLKFNSCVSCKPIKTKISLHSFRFTKAPRRPRRLRRPFKLVRGI